MKKKYLTKRIAGALCVCMAAGMAAVPGTVREVQAESGIQTMNLDKTYLNPSDQVWDSSDDKVYFGKYNGSPVAYRVLKSGDGRLFLDCDTVLFTKAFDEDKVKNAGQNMYVNEWHGSDLANWLNGKDFLENTDNFSAAEKGAVAQTVWNEGSETIDHVVYKEYASQDAVFLLSAAEARDYYGAENTDVRTKTDGAGTGSKGWWLRSVSPSYGSLVGLVNVSGKISDFLAVDYEFGVSPALQLDLSDILFTSSGGVDKSSDTLQQVGDAQTERMWKLTVLDSSKKAGIQAGKHITNEGNTITIPYTYSGENVSQISVMVTDKNYQAADARILYYGRLNTELQSNGTGTVTLPEGVFESSSIYLLAEDVNGAQETDYASVPVPIKETETPGHVHNWSAEWSHDAQAHWHECTQAGCEVTENTEKEGYGTHAFGAWVLGQVHKKRTCTVCGYEEVHNKGDINEDGEVDIKDLKLCLNHVSGTAELDSHKESLADMTGDGVADISDLMQILNIVSGKTQENSRVFHPVMVMVVPALCELTMDIQRTL